MMVHSHDCWQEASVPHHTGLSLGLLYCLRDLATGLIQSEGCERDSKTEATTLSSMSSPQKSHITSAMFYWSHRQC